MEWTDFIIAKQKQEMKRVKAEKEAALAAKEETETERLFFEGENKAKEIYRLFLDNEIADKERQLKDKSIEFYLLQHIGTVCVLCCISFISEIVLFSVGVISALLDGVHL